LTQFISFLRGFIVGADIFGSIVFSGPRASDIPVLVGTMATVDLFAG
jgi:hypothetical protein